MISEVVMPQMGADMEEGTVVRWIKREGEPVERGEIIAEIETDKANIEIEAFESGVFRKTLANEGDTVTVGTIIAVITAPDDDISGYQPAAVAPAPARTAAVDAGPAPAGTESEPGVETPAGPPARAPARTDSRVRASPIARKLAQEKGIDLAQLQGTGPDGRIVRRDVEAAVQHPSAPSAPPSTETAGMSRMRRAIARRMAQSKREAPHYYVTLDIDMTEAERLRREINDGPSGEVRISVNDVIVKACAMALDQHPMFNTWLVDGGVRRHQAINVCVAVSLEDGLIAPAILDCGNKSLTEIAQASRDLAERARTGALKPDEYSAGTFTVSNLGMYGVETLVAIIQPPQTAILGVGAVRQAPVVGDDGLTVAHLMKVALSADHRVTDGAQGAQFLSEIRRLLDNPAALLV